MNFKATTYGSIAIIAAVLIPIELIVLFFPNTSSPAALSLALIFAALILGGYVAARFAPGHELFYASTTAVVPFFASLYFVLTSSAQRLASMGPGGQALPRWIHVLSVVGGLGFFILIGRIGGALRLRELKRRRRDANSIQRDGANSV